MPVDSAVASFQLGEFPLGDVDVRDDDATLVVLGQRCGAHQEPPLLLGRVTGVLQREDVALAFDNRLQPLQGLGGVLVGVGVGLLEVVDADQFVALLWPHTGELVPGPVGEEDRPLLVEDCDVERERVERQTGERVALYHTEDCSL